MNSHLLVLTLVLFWGCSSGAQNKQQLNRTTDIIEYVKSPDSTDISCLEDVKRAKEEVHRGKITLTQLGGLGFDFLRYEKELIQLCQDYGLRFEYELLSCIVQEGQTQGCYGAYMDNELINRFGPNFKVNLFRKADSLFLVNVVREKMIVRSWDCDIAPVEPKDFDPTIDVSELDIKRGDDAFGGWPFHDITFVIELDSTVSEIQSTNFVAGDSANVNYETILYEVAMNYLNQNSTWIPGSIRTEAVRTRHSLRFTYLR